MNLDRLLVSIMLVAFAYVPLRAQTFNNELEEYGSSSAQLRIGKQTGASQSSVSVASSDKTNSEAESSFLVTDNSNAYTFERATSITSGKRYLIVADVADSYYAAVSKDDNTIENIKSIKVPLSDNIISITDEKLIFTLEGNNINGFTIKQPNGQYWINKSTDNIAGLLSVSRSTTYGYWNISFGNNISYIQNIKSKSYIALNNKQIFIAYVSRRSGNRVTLYEEVSTPSQVNVSVSKVGYATLYYSDIALRVPEGVTAMAYAYDGTNTLVKSKTYEAGSVIPKGVAVVLKAHEGNYTFMASNETGERPEKTNLYGFDVNATTYVDYLYKYYMLSLNANNDPNSVGFYWGADNGDKFTTGAHKAFLALPKSATAKGFAFEDIVDEISSVGMDVNNTDAPIYTLTGVRMTGKLPAGIYVNKGKKFMVR